MTPQAYVQQKAASSGSSFYYAFLFLPAPRRAAITAFYAFCREVDDVVDEISDPSVAQSTLAWWQTEVVQAFAGKPTHPVMQALMPHTQVYGIEDKHLLSVIEGCQMDLNQTRYLDYAGLQRYCHLVAGVVGEVAAKIFDVKVQDVLKGQYSDRFTALMRFQAQRAHALYEQAFSMLPSSDRRAQKPGLMMASIYRTLLQEIEADSYQVLHQRISLTPLRKLWLAWKVQALGRL